MLAVAVGHPENEKPFAFMARADFRRAEEAALNLAAQAEKVSSNSLGAALGEHAADVFDEDEPSARRDEDAASRAPEVALVFTSKPLSGKAVGLAGNTPDDAIHRATEASARDGSHITPDRRRSHDTLLHLRDQISGGEAFPLHTQHRASRWDCQLNGPIKAPSAGTQGDDVEGSGPGTKIHTHEASLSKSGPCRIASTRRSEASAKRFN